MVTTDGEHIAVADGDGAVKSIAKRDIAAVLIETNDSGPWGTDFWWLFLDGAKHLTCAVPQGATGEQPMIDWLLTLPRFDHDAMIRASSSTGNAFFEVWRADAV